MASVFSTLSMTVIIKADLCGIHPWDAKMKSQHLNMLYSQNWPLWPVLCLCASVCLRHTCVNTSSRGADTKIDEAQGTYNQDYSPTMKSNKEHHTALTPGFIPCVMLSCHILGWLNCENKSCLTEQDSKYHTSKKVLLHCHSSSHQGWQRMVCHSEATAGILQEAGDGWEWCVWLEIGDLAF